jgi:hypothetical protein
LKCLVDTPGKLSANLTGPRRSRLLKLRFKRYRMSEETVLPHHTGKKLLRLRPYPSFYPSLATALSIDSKAQEIGMSETIELKLAIGRLQTVKPCDICGECTDKAANAPIKKCLNFARGGQAKAAMSSFAKRASRGTSAYLGKPHRVFARSYRQIENPDPPAKPGKKMSKEDWKGEIAEIVFVIIIANSRRATRRLRRLAAARM